MLCNIRDEFSKNGDRLREMLAHRLQFSDHLTWGNVCDCLREEIVGRNDLANDIKKKFKGK